MKKLHLICNSHLDPVWMWDWEEGLGAAISTFWQAAEFCEEFDFVFNHNEAVLYEFIEEHDPALFAHIQKLVREGKWHIMGGWYLQPDCNLPSGEAFVRQIALGRKYFQEKFGARPTTAINFDSFGHTVGLVQILKKCGYDSYLCCRPNLWMMELPRDFWWVGKDGSRVKVTRTTDENLYSTTYGNALKEIRRMDESYTDGENGVGLWGVGNHGGLPSRKDLEDVQGFIAEADHPVVHSTPEQYFSELEPTEEFYRSMQPCLIGAYTSMSRIKCKHIALEHKLFTTEKLCSVAALNGLYQKDYQAFEDVQKALASLEFHDILSGTCCPDGEKSTMAMADHALELLRREFNKAFFALCGRYTKAQPDQFPVFIFNSQPYGDSPVCEAEILMIHGISDDERQYTVTVRQDGKVIPSQCIKEQSDINYDRRKRIAFRPELNPMGITRVDIQVDITPKQPAPQTPEGPIVFKDSVKELIISRETGLLESYTVGGKQLLSGGAFQPVMFQDNADPWGWWMDAIGKNPRPFALADCTEGPFKGLRNVQVTEDGPVLTQVESLFKLEQSYVQVAYKIYKDLPYTDVTLDVFWNQQDDALKIKIPTALEGRFIGQIPYGTEEFEKNGNEITAHRFIGMDDGDGVLTVYNDCTYGFCAQGKDLYATLLRGAAYCAHPIGDRSLVKDPTRFTTYVEQGRHTFRFRLSWDPRQELESNALSFINKPYCLNFFPHGEGAQQSLGLAVDNKAVSLWAFYQTEEGYILRLVNNTPSAQTAVVTVAGHSFSFSFDPFEAKGCLFDGNTLTELQQWL